MYLKVIQDMEYPQETSVSDLELQILMLGTDLADRASPSETP